MNIWLIRFTETVSRVIISKRYNLSILNHYVVIITSYITWLWCIFVYTDDIMDWNKPYAHLDKIFWNKYTSQSSNFSPEEEIWNLPPKSNTSLSEITQKDINTAVSPPPTTQQEIAITISQPNKKINNAILEILYNKIQAGEKIHTVIHPNDFSEYFFELSGWDNSQYDVYINQTKTGMIHMERKNSQIHKSLKLRVGDVWIFMYEHHMSLPPFEYGSTQGVRTNQHKKLIHDITQSIASWYINPEEHPTLWKILWSYSYAYPNTK